jgi:hypothetical protein
MRRGEFADIVLACGEAAQHCTARAIGECMEDAIKRGGAFLSHARQPMSAIRKDQPFGITFGRAAC